MTEAEKVKLVGEWIEFQSVPLAERSREFRKNHELNCCQAIKQLDDACRSDPELAWGLILRINSAELNENATAVLAAGALEDLLAQHGAQFIDRVEIEARRDAKFNHLLGGVWQNSMTEDVWARVQKARREVW